MKTSEYISFKVDRFAKGYVFTYDNLKLDSNKKEAALKALNRMVKSGKIAKLSKGKFYKPEGTIFGDLKPKQAQVFKDLLEENGKITGYITGFSIYNKLGLTTQVSATIQIGKNQVRSTFKRDYYTISILHQKNTITKDNIQLLQILDAIRYIKRIPDANIESCCKRFLGIFKNFEDKDYTAIVRLSLKYPPASRALLGALMDQIQQSTLAEPLYKSLNPFTKYKLSGAEKVLTNTKRWNIV